MNEKKKTQISLQYNGIFSKWLRDLKYIIFVRDGDDDDAAAPVFLLNFVCAPHF